MDGRDGAYVLSSNSASDFALPRLSGAQGRPSKHDLSTAWDVAFNPEGPLGIEFFWEEDDRQLRVFGVHDSALVEKVPIGSCLLAVNGENVSNWTFEDILHRIKSSSLGQRHRVLRFCLVDSARDKTDRNEERPETSSSSVSASSSTSFNQRNGGVDRSDLPSIKSATKEESHTEGHTRVINHASKQKVRQLKALERASSPSSQQQTNGQSSDDREDSRSPSGERDSRPDSPCNQDTRPISPNAQSSRPPSPARPSSRQSRKSSLMLTNRSNNLKDNANRRRSTHLSSGKLSRGHLLTANQSISSGINRPLLLLQVESVIESLSPLHHDVRNDSYQWKQRHVLGPKRYWYRGLEHSTAGNGKSIEARIYKWGIDKKTLQQHPVSTLLGVCPNEDQALRVINEAVRERDRQDPDIPEIKANSPDALCSHLSVTVISVEFHGKSLYERLSIVYEKLLREFCQPLPHYMLPASGRAVKWRYFSTVGGNSARLPHMRGLSTQFSIVTKSPAQWNPEKYPPSALERFGSHFLSPKTLGVDNLALITPVDFHRLMKAEEEIEKGFKKDRPSSSTSSSAATKIERREKRTENSDEESEQEGTASFLKKKHSLTEKAEKAKEKKKKKKAKLQDVKQNSDNREDTGVGGGGKAHFFHALKPEVKKMVVEEVMEQARKQKGKKPTESRKSMVALAKMYGQPIAEKTDPNAKMVIRWREMNIAACKLQRIYRARLQSKILRWMNRRHLNALHIQRSYRGHVERTFVREYRKIANYAAVMIQAVYRSYRSRQQTRRMREQYLKATMLLQRVARGFQARKAVHFMRQYNNQALQIQRVWRGMRGRKEAKALREKRYLEEVLIPAAVSIQRIWRGHVARKLAAILRAERYRLTVLEPSAVRIQSIYRRHLAIKEKELLRAKRNAAMKIQSNVRRWRQRKRFKLILEHKHRYETACILQAFGRAAIARAVMRRRRRMRFFEQVEIPSAITMQKIYRGYKCRKAIGDRRKRWYAAYMIQYNYRIVLKTRKRQLMWQGLAQGYKGAMAHRIQSAFRCFLAKKIYHRLILEKRGRERLAVVKIQSVYRGFVSRERVRVLKVVSLIQETKDNLQDCEEEMQLIQFDMDDVQTDLNRARRWLKNVTKRTEFLKVHREEMSRRLEEVKVELKDVKPEDEEQGWLDSLKDEDYFLSRQLEMSAEDVLSLRIQIRELVNTLEDLELELEDLEVDLDENWVREVEHLEFLRRLELAYCSVLRRKDRDRSIRKQKSRWKVTGVRPHKIRRNQTGALKSLQEIQSQARKQMTLEELQTISFKKKMDRVQREDAYVQNAIHAIRKEQAKKILQEAIDAEGTGAGKFLHESADVIAKLSADIVAESTFEFRRPKSDIRADRKEVCWECGKVFCICPASKSITHKREIIRKKR